MMASDTRAVEGERAVSNDLLVDADWLETNLGNPNLRIGEVGGVSHSYDDWHIDGAVLWNVYRDLKGPDYRPVGTAALQQLVARSGSGSDSTVVFYGYSPALGLWLMDLYGYRDVRILDCSREAWRTDGRPWTTSAPGTVAGHGLPGDGHGPSRADRDDVLRSIGTPGETLVDVRSEAEFVGE